VIQDTHEDPVLQEYKALLTQQSSETVETLRWNTVKAGTNRFFANGTQRTDVNTPITLELQRKATEALGNQRGMYIEDVVSSTPSFRTEPVEASYIGVCHVNVVRDIRNMEGFTPVKQYNHGKAFANEVGAVEDVRYVRSTLFTAFADAGGLKGAMKSTAGTNADVYPVIIFAKDSYGIVPLKGKSVMSLIVKNPGSAGSADPLNQRGTIGWRLYHASVILNDLWMVRLEVAATA
jgi:N4-gp56 family major capsid protein